MDFIYGIIGLIIRDTPFDIPAVIRADNTHHECMLNNGKTTEVKVATKGMHSHISILQAFHTKEKKNYTLKF